MAKSPAKPDRYVFLDRDGIINVERGDYTVSIDEWQWAPGAREGIKMLTDAGFGVIVITNQACIAKGCQTEEGLAILHDFMLDGIRTAGGDILRIYHCPHQTPDNCSCRKPEPGMLLQAADDYDISLEKTFFVGDTSRDMETARRAGTKKILIVNDVNAYQPVEDVETDFCAANLTDAAEIVIRETKV